MDDVAAMLILGGKLGIYSEIANWLFGAGYSRDESWGNSRLIARISLSETGGLLLDSAAPPEKRIATRDIHPRVRAQV